MSPITKLVPVVALFATLQAIAAAPVHSLQQGGQCLQVSGSPSNGAAVTLGACNSNNAQSGTATGQQWVISPGNNPSVQLYGSNFCLDGQADVAGRETVVFPCIQNAAQTFYLTGDNRLAITGGTQCLTAANGGVETEDCAPNVAAQAFTPTLLFDTDTVSSSAVGIGAAGSSAASSAAGSASSAASSAASGVSASASSAASAASSAASAATASASSAAASASSAVGSATQSASSAIQSATDSAASAASSAASGASSVASDATSGVASAATSAVSAATSGAGSIGSAVTSALQSATSAAGGGTGGALNVKQIAAGFWVAVGVAVGVAVVA